MGLEQKTLRCDLCVIGGGLSGITAAISAAREGIKVVLMHERPMLGGNASSEIRMWVSGAPGENNRETGIIEEIMIENCYRNPTRNYPVWDSILYDFVKRENNITLLLNCTCMDANVENGSFANGRNVKINSVKGYQMTTQYFYNVEAKYFCDSSGDSVLAPLCNAEFRLGRESKQEFGEDTQVEKSDDMTMGMSCLVYGRETDKKVDFIAPEWVTKLSDESFCNEFRNPDPYLPDQNYWYLELGGDKDTIGETETVRDELLSLALGTWDYIKNSKKYNADNWDLDFLGFLPGKRESRRMCGEYMITQRDISDGKVFEDEIAFGGWPLDDHFPAGFYQKGVPNTDIKTPAPYSLPYRSLYSKNVENLYFAGRNISMTHTAMSSIRVMATCALLGEAVGKAAAIATKKDTTPHGVFCDYLNLLQELLLSEDCFLPNFKRSISKTCKNAVLLGADDRIRNGEDRPHSIYGTDNDSYACRVRANDSIEYTFDKTEIKSVHITFDSDLNRDTLEGDWVERQRATRANVRSNASQMYMPKTLCKEFEFIGEVDGMKEELLHITHNRKRSYHLTLNKPYEKLRLIPISDWGQNECITIVSFDF